MSKILITTGGTGGHIYPALAVAEELKKQGHDLIFLGTIHRMEKDIIPQEGYKYYGLDILPLNSIKNVFKMLKGILDARRILKENKVDKVIGFGNYISLPALIAAKLLRKKIYLQEQNVSMGMANKLMYRFSDKVFLAFGETLKFIKDKYKKNCVVTGNPLRKEFYDIDKEKARKILNIPENKKVITVMGGSLGARNINESIISNFNKFGNDVILYWSTGKELYKESTDKLEIRENTVVLPYLENSYINIAASDLMICRAGASTISELIELEKPSILIPYNFVGQKENSEILEVINAAKVYSNDDVDLGINEALRIINDETLLEFMRESIRKINPGNAVKNICEYIK